MLHGKKNLSEKPRGHDMMWVNGSRPHSRAFLCLTKPWTCCRHRAREAVVKRTTPCSSKIFYNILIVAVTCGELNIKTSACPTHLRILFVVINTYLQPVYAIMFKQVSVKEEI